MDEATQKGLATRQRRWEARNEKRRLKALEEEAKAAHKPQKKTEEKYDAVQSDFTAPKRKIGIRDEPC